ncbi:MAG TPA: AAA family ATPase, partial [Thermoleophilaceae bacterium]
MQELTAQQERFGDRLLDREAELSALGEMAALASSGQGGVTVVEGPAGIGKSRLLEEVAGVARDAGLESLTARGTELERELPFGVVRQLFEARLFALEPAERDEVLSGAAAVSAPIFLDLPADAPLLDAEPASAHHGLYWLTANLAVRAPLAIVVDDAHWADPASLRFLVYLANRASDLPVLLVVARRHPEPEVDTDLTDRIAAVPRARTLRPRALRHDAVAVLVRVVLDAEPDASFAAACHRSTGGNPLFLRELLQSLAGDGVVPSAAAAERVMSVAPESVARLVRRRLRALGTAAVELARAIAVLGDGSDLAAAARLATIGPDESLAAADALARFDLLAPGEARFVHPIVRAAVYSELPGAEAARMHSRAAVLLAERGDDDDRVAVQLLAAEPGDGRWAVETLRR